MFSHIMLTFDSMCPLKHYKVAQAKDPWITNEFSEMILNKK